MADDGSDMAKLKQLKMFFEQGLIEEDEFNEQKAVLLDRIMNKPVRASTAQPAASRQTQATPPRESQQPRAQAPRESQQPRTQPQSASPAPAVNRQTQAASSRRTVAPQPVPAELAKPAGPKQRAPDECWECGERLYGKVASAYDHNWHMDCFKCNVCKTTLVGVAFYPEGDEVVCAKHIGASAANTCPKCQQIIDNDYVEAEGDRYHAHCFVCAYGGCGLDAGWARGADGEVYCYLHLNLLNNSNCAECGKMVTRDLVTFHGRKFHGKCFVCAFCQNPLSGNKFYDFQKQPFCYECHTSLHYAKKN